jgi:hypothetical protein
MTNNAFVFSKRASWLIAGLIATLGSLPVACYGNSSPWLIVIPIGFGVAVITLLRLIGEKDEFLKLIREEDATQDEPEVVKSPTELFACGSITVDKTNWPDEPRGFVELDPAFEEEATSILVRQQRLVMTGASGTGKTTCALHLCRKYDELNGRSPLKRAPVFISFSQSKKVDGLSSTLLEQVSEQVRISNALDYGKDVRKIMKEGLVFLVLDDLDYMKKSDERELESFITQWEKNAFLFIISEIPPSSFFSNKHFGSITMQEWKPNQVQIYVDRRVHDPERKSQFLATLKQAHMLDHPMLPYNARFLVEACLNGTFHQLLDLRNSSEKDYGITDSLLRIIIAGGDHQKYLERIRLLGRLALKLLKDGRSNFIPENEGIDESVLKELMSKLFLQKNEYVSFSESNYQIFLAGRYIAEFWPDARLELRDASARVLIWKPVYNCAQKFISPDFAEEFEDSFRRLALNLI